MALDRPPTYVVLFWSDLAQDITWNLSSLSKATAIAAAQKFLVELHVPEAGYRDFLSERLASWNGMQSRVTAISEGKLVIFATVVDQGQGV